MNLQRKDSSPGFLGWLTLLFIGLKLTNHIAWPWIWVLSPIWLTFLSYFCLSAFTRRKEFTHVLKGVLKHRR